jgi:transcriptional regulator with XRE-family HTH domain
VTCDVTRTPTQGPSVGRRQRAMRPKDLFQLGLDRNALAHQRRLARNRPRPIAASGATWSQRSRSPGTHGKDDRDRGGSSGFVRSPEVQAAIEAADARRLAENLARDRARTHRPIADDEIEQLEALGSEIRRLRHEAGLTLKQLAGRADRHLSYVARIERGSRRARTETLEKIADVFASAGLGEADELTARFVGMAGLSLAPASVWPGWAEKIEKRRQKRKLRRGAPAENERKKE